MENREILNKFISFINTLSDEDLRHLALLFGQRNVKESVVNLIEITLALRKAERDSRAGKKQKNITDRNDKPDVRQVKSQQAQNGQQDIRTFAGVREAFVEMLNDRRIFPSTKDVVKALNESFNMEINYTDYYKRGRRDLISNCLRYLSRYPNKQQLDMVKKFLKDMSNELIGIKQYRQLFEILAGYE